MGRPTKLNSEVQERIVEALRAGNYQEIAAKYAGVSDATFHNWMARGREEQRRITEGEKADPEEAAFLEFFVVVEKARSEAEVRNVMQIQHASRDHWQAAAWFLERSFPKRWGRKDRHEVTGADGEALKISVSTDELEERVQALLNKKQNGKK
jgi:transposase-like protein